jgi:hypothetical protein
MTRFKQFILERQLAEYLNYLDTLSEQQLHEELDSLDEDTYQLVESAINEGIGKTLKRLAVAGALVGAGAMGARHFMKPSSTVPPQQQGIKHVAPSSQSSQRVTDDGETLTIPGSDDDKPLVIPGMGKKPKPSKITTPYDDGETLTIPR